MLWFRKTKKIQAVLMQGKKEKSSSPFQLPAPGAPQRQALLRGAHWRGAAALNPSFYLNGGQVPTGAPSQGLRDQAALPRSGSLSVSRSVCPLPLFSALHSLPLAFPSCPNGSPVLHFHFTKLNLTHA